MEEKDKAMRGEVFKAGDPDLKREREYAKALCFKYNHTDPNDENEKVSIIKDLIGNIKGKFTINAPFYCDYGRYITIGENFFANYNCVIVDGGQVIFKDDVRIGPNCTFCTPNHDMNAERRKEGYMQYKNIVVGNNVWFGAGVTVLPGVTIGDNSVIGAGSVVTKDIPDNVFAAGNPCRVIKTLNNQE